MIGEFSIIVLGKVFALIVSIVGIRVLTDVVSPSVYGKFGIVLTFTAFGELLFGILSQGISRYYFEARNRGEYVVIKSVFFYFTKRIVTGLFFFIPFVYYYTQSWVAAFCVPFYSIFSGFALSFSGIQNSERHRMIVTLHEIVDKLFKYGGIILFSFIAAMTVEWMILSYTVFMFVIVLSQTYFYNKQIEKKFDKHYIGQFELKIEDYKKKILNYITPFIIWTIFSWIQTSSDRWILENRMSSYEVGLYQVLNQYGFQIISIGMSMILTLIMPILFERAAFANDQNGIIRSVRINNKLVILALLLLAFGFLVTYFFHSFLFYYLASSEYQKVSFLLPWMILAGGLFGIGQMLSNNFMISYKSYKLLKPKIGTALFSVAMSWMLTNSYGIGGLVTAVLSAQLLYAFWLYFLSIKMLKESKNKKFDLNK